MNQKKKKYERGRGITFLCGMRIRRGKIKEDKGTKLYVKLKPSMRNMYRQYLVIYQN